MGYRAEVDKDLCMSAGKCVADHPAAFAFDDDQIAEALPDTTETDEQLLDAARTCPSEAILVYDESGDEVPL